MRLYLAGPMRGYPEFNQHAFNDTAKILESMGHQPFNPAKADRDAGHNWDGASGTSGELQDAQYNLNASLLDDLTYIAEQAHGVVVLDGWQNSKGATAECALAVALDIPLYRLCDGSLVYVDATPKWVVPEHAQALPVPIPGQLEMSAATA